MPEALAYAAALVALGWLCSVAHIAACLACGPFRTLASIAVVVLPASYVVWLVVEIWPWAYHR